MSDIDFESVTPQSQSTPNQKRDEEQEAYVHEVHESVSSLDESSILTGVTPIANKEIPPPVDGSIKGKSHGIWKTNRGEFRKKTIPRTVSILTWKSAGAADQ